MPVWEQAKQLAGEATMPNGIVSGCEVKKHSTGLIFSLKIILDVLGQQSDLIHSRFPASKTSLLLRQVWIYYWFKAGMDKTLENFKGDTEQRYRTIALRVPLEVYEA